MQQDFSDSIILNTDSYKASMFEQYPSGTEAVYSYISSRGGIHDQTVFFGLQDFLVNYLSKPITREQIEAAAIFWPAHGEPFNREGWEYILNEHQGRLPLRIRAVREGTVVPTKNVLVTVENTDKKCAWLTTYVESSMLRAVWYATTVATNSWHIKQIIKGYLEKSGDVLGLGFKLHDFGLRGASSFESAAIGGMAHLVNFMGTDTVSGIFRAVKSYDADIRNTAFSIAASEHSTITSWGRENEFAAYENMVDKFAKPGATFACVSDSYNIYEACKMWCRLADKIKAAGATLVVRPDSGIPDEVIRKILPILEQGFGSVVNDKGYKVLNNVRIIWGDGINQMSIQSILRVVVDVLGFSIDNIAFGMGGALLQGVTRDDQKFAMKASAALVNGVWVDVFKDPVDDPGKASFKGRVTLFKNDQGKYYTGVEDWMKDELVTVFENGEILNKTTFNEVRKNSEK